MQKKPEVLSDLAKPFFVSYACKDKKIRLWHCNSVNGWKNPKTRKSPGKRAKKEILFDQMAALSDNCLLLGQPVELQGKPVDVLDTDNGLSIARKNDQL